MKTIPSNLVTFFIIISLSISCGKNQKKSETNSMDEIVSADAEGSPCGNQEALALSADTTPILPEGEGLFDILNSIGQTSNTDSTSNNYASNRDEIYDEFASIKAGRYDEIASKDKAPCK